MEVIASLAARPSALPFSAGIKSGELVFLSGQGGFVPETGRLIEGGIEAQTEQTIKNVAALLAKAGCTLADVVSCLVHLSDLSLYAKFNEAYARSFAEPRPTRTTVGANLVLGMQVEITAVARVPAAPGASAR